MSIVNKIKRLIKGRAYRKSVENTAAMINSMVGALKETLTSYEVEESVLVALEANKKAIENINWESIQNILDALKQELDKHNPIISALADAAQANIELIKAEFQAQDKEDGE